MSDSGSVSGPRLSTGTRLLICGGLIPLIGGLVTGEVFALPLSHALDADLRAAWRDVRAPAAAGEDQQAVTDRLVPAITQLYPGWDKQMLLPFEIAILHAEATGNPPQVPVF